MDDIYRQQNSYIYNKKYLFNRREKEIVLSKTNGRCSHCGKGLNVEEMTVDHIFPKSKGGLNDEYNLLPLCVDCNEKKSNSVYRLGDYYKYINIDEFDRFEKYSNFASFEYVMNSILGYDELAISFLSDRGLSIAAQMKKRGASVSKIAKTCEKMNVKVLLKKAYPADAKRIFELMQKNIAKDNNIITSSPYMNDAALLNAITNGVVYILEKGDDLCGAFVFEPASYALSAGIPIQLSNIAEHAGLTIKYVMTFATVTYFSRNAFDKIMSRLDHSQLSNGWLPVYFNILGPMYVNKDKCFFLPYNMNGQDGSLEFMQYTEIMNNLNEGYADAFKEFGYEPDEYEKTLFSGYVLTKNYQSDFEGDDEAKEFFRKYPQMLLMFKPEEYEYYGIGFLYKYNNKAKAG